MTKAYAIALFALSFIPSVARAELMLLLTSREGWIEFVDPESLQLKGRIATGKLIHSAQASTDGATLFVTCRGLLNLKAAVRSKL